MASPNEAEIIAGRRTRSGRRVSGTQPTPSPIRTTRRTQKKLTQELLTVPEPEVEEKPELTEEPETTSALSQQSDVIKEMLAEAAQGTIIDNEGDDDDGDGDGGAFTTDPEVIEIPDNDFADVDDFIEEDHKQDDEDDDDDCIIYEEEPVEEEQQCEDIEMFTILEDEPEQTINETPANSSTAAIDEKSSSFPFGNVVQSETSEDLQNEEVGEDNNDEAAADGTVDSSLLASLAGDNANSLPSVGGEEQDNKKDDFEERTVEPINASVELMESDDSLSEPAVAEEIPDGDPSNATIVNTEMVSEDELPMPTKPEINDAEEVSDDELPAPQRAELPPDAEVISEDELPSTTTTDKKSPSSSVKASDGIGRQKRKAEADDIKSDEHKNEGENKENKEADEVKADMNAQYNPMSPTGESNDATPPVEKKAKIDVEENSTESKEKKKDSKEKEKEKEKDKEKDKEKEKEKEKDKEKEKEKEKEREKEKDKDKEKEKEKKKLPDLDKYWRSVREDPADFTGWTYLLQYVDNESDAEAAREAYDAFLSHYPYCYGYWRKYADYEKRKGIKANCNTVFERGLEAIPLSVDLWIHYLAHVKNNNTNDNEDFIRAQFERAINACGLEFRSDKLWDAYIKWENDNKRYQRIVQIYDRLLAIPTQGYSGHFDNFQDLINQHSLTSTISNEELLKIRTDLRETTSRSSKSKERRATSKEKDHKESSKSGDKDKEHKESSKNSDKDKEHKDSSKSGDKDKDKDHKESSKSSDKEKEHKDSSKSSEKDKENKDSSKSCEKDKENKDSQKNVDNEKEKDKDEKDEKEDLDKSSPKKIAKDAVETSKGNTSETEAMDTDAKVEKVVVKEPNLLDMTTLTESEICSMKDKVISIRRKLHKNTVAAVTARWTYEEGIKRPYFHVKPLERCQLKNWKDYLDFEIEKGDRKRILVLFERCLIACALYDEFWLKMIRYLETMLDQPNIPEMTSDVYRRACEIHHPDKPSLHLMWSAFEECRNNFDVASEVLVKLEKKCPNLLQVAYRRINVERRRGDISKCKELYELYISTAKNKTIAGSLAIKYARFLNKICNDIDSGLRVLRQTLEKDLGNTRVALQMIDLTLQRPKVDEDEVVLIMDKFMARENIDPEQKVLFAQRKVEFLEDFGSTAKGLQDAQRSLQVALNKANEAKKKRESSPSRKSSANAKDGISSSSLAQSNTYNNGATAANSYNYNSANAAYYGQQNSSAYQQSYDGYYNQWQYGGGSNYGGYGQWSGYGNYY